LHFQIRAIRVIRGSFIPHTFKLNLGHRLQRLPNGINERFISTATKSFLAHWKSFWLRQIFFWRGMLKDFTPGRFQLQENPSWRT